MNKLALVLALAATPAVADSGFGVEATAAADGGAIGFTIVNDGSEAVSGVRWYPAPGFAVHCAVQTDAGRGFASGAVLQAGDRAACTMTPLGTTAALARSAAVVVSAHEADGAVTVRHAGMTLLGGATPAQGIVVVAAGAVHADTDLDGEIDAGEGIAYDYTVVNAGTQALSGLLVADRTGALACPSSALAVDQAMTCTSAYVAVPDDAASGLVLNEVEVTGSAEDGQTVQAADVILTLNLAGSAGIRVFKSPLLLDDADGSGYASAGDVLGYTFLVKNSHAQSLSSVDLTEPDPSLIDGPIQCESETLVGGQPFGALGAGMLASQDVLRCRAQHTISAAEAAAGEALNLVEASGVAAIGGQVWGTGASAVAIPGPAQIVVTKSVDTPVSTYGGEVTYTITVRNAGSTDIPNVTISDPIPNGLSTFDWTCAGTGVACPAASGSGAIAATVPLFPAGAQLVYTVRATVALNAPQQILNTVTVTPEANVSCVPAGTPAPCAATVPLMMGEPRAVPVGGLPMQLILGALLALGAAFGFRMRGA
ncbi:MAG TPA: DUF11 domain-containing protein [Dokdonella sp.]|uniref:DUF11 domain-containing protein n=1 Tax=Dokdonella sp. TaxID=2291710 RepID=UPI002C9A13E9|nr:DUF11 domain-containing protein [Dokdonella sp.]HUD40666.1 DUF11 domain-containing protein [Dokdonella sp.]